MRIICAPHNVAERAVLLRCGLIWEVRGNRACARPQPLYDKESKIYRLSPGLGAADERRYIGFGSALLLLGCRNSARSATLYVYRLVRTLCIVYVPRCVQSEYY